MAAETPKIDLKYTCFRLLVHSSKIHRWGVRAAEFIPAGHKVIEYTGERISRRETKIRAARSLNYIFTLNKYWSIDGAVGGSGAEFINHSCEPNLKTRILRGHILYFSKRPIETGEELTVDYRFAADATTAECSCRSEKCRGTINLLV